MSRQPVAILISGAGSNMLRLLEDMDRPDHPARPVCVLADTAAPGLDAAARRGLLAEAISTDGGRAVFAARLDRALGAAGAEILCLAGFMRILSAAFVEAWAGRILNIHPSLLPLFPGLNTHARALAAGVAVHGATVHEVTATLDGGPIRGQAVLAVQPGDTAETLAARVLGLEHRLYPEVLRRFAVGDRNPVAILA